MLVSVESVQMKRLEALSQGHIVISNFEHQFGVIEVSEGMATLKELEPQQRVPYKRTHGILDDAVIFEKGLLE